MVNQGLAKDGSDLYTTELELEKLSQSMGLKRYQENLARADQTNTTPGLRLMNDLIGPLADGIREWYEQSKAGRANRNANLFRYLDRLTDKQGNVEFYTIAYHTLRIAIDGIIVKELPTVTQSARLLAKCLDEEVMHREFQAEAPGLYYTIDKTLKDSASQSMEHRSRTFRHAARKFDVKVGERWSDAERIKIGWNLLQLCADTCGIITIERTNKKNKTPYQIHGNPAFVKRLEEAHEQCQLLQPVYLPMVVEPVDWTSPVDGGYLDKVTMMSSRLVKTRSKAYIEDLYNHDMPKVYDAVNTLQKTPWAINRFVLDTMQQVWEQGGGWAGLPSREELPLPPKPEDIDTNETAKRNWKYRARDIHKTNSRSLAKRLSMVHKLWLANEFKTYDQFWFVWTIDWRGRAYPETAFVNPQADDSGKALLRFAQGKPLGQAGAYWLAVHLANLWGYDKCSLDDRVAWVREHEKQILDSVTQPTDCRWWADADKPWQFLAACAEWVGYLVEGSTYVSHLPVSVDGSCNGLQNYSAMLRDHIGGVEVNLVPGDKPRDIYTAVADVVEGKLTESDNELAKYWQGNVTRGIVKRPVMTLPYAATQYGMADQISDEYVKKDMKFLPEDKQSDCCIFLSRVVYEAIGEVVVAARQAMDWLQDTARKVAKYDVPVSWTSPVGFPVIQAYNKQQDARVDAMIQGQRRYFTLKKELPSVDKKKQASSIAPNFIHSMDAAHMMLTVLRARDEFGLKDFSMVHDSFGTHACDVDALSYALREAFVEMYSDDVLGNFRDEVAEQTDEVLKPLPEFGELDLELVRESDFFFA